jgi:hypothetical protein
MSAHHRVKSPLTISEMRIGSLPGKATTFISTHPFRKFHLALGSCSEGESGHHSK